MQVRSSGRLPGGVLILITLLLAAGGAAAEDPRGEAGRLRDALHKSRGLCVVLGDPNFALELAREGGMTVFVQSPKTEEVEVLCKAADVAGLLGKRLWVQKGDYTRLHLANDLADAVVVGSATPPESELMRVLRPK